MTFGLTGMWTLICGRHTQESNRFVRHEVKEPRFQFKRVVSISERIEVRTCDLCTCWIRRWLNLICDDISLVFLCPLDLDLQGWGTEGTDDLIIPMYVITFSGFLDIQVTIFILWKYLKAQNFPINVTWETSPLSVVCFTKIFIKIHIVLHFILNFVMDPVSHFFLLVVLMAS